MVAGQIGGLDQQGELVLAVGDIKPGETGEEPGPEQIEPDPDQRCGPEYRRRFVDSAAAPRKLLRPPGGEEYQQCGKKGRVNGHVEGQQEQGRQRHRRGHPAVLPQHHRDPVQEGNEIDQAGQQTQEGGPAPGNPAQRQQQRDQAEPGQ